MTDVSAPIAPTAVPSVGGRVSGPDITTVSTPGSPIPWHHAVEPDVKAYWQSKGYDISDPAKIAVAASKGHLEATKFLGVPANQLLRLPADVNDEVGWANVWARLGAPADKSGYDFSTVKFSDGTDLDSGFADFMREKAHELHLPTQTAAQLSKSFVSFMEQADRREAEQGARQLSEEKAQIAKDWGNDYEFNRQTAVQGAQKLKVTAEDVAALEKVVGYARVMEMFRKVGAGSNEDSYIPGKQGGEFMTTAQTAQARLNELMANQQWAARLVQNEPEARKEFESLTRLISGYVPDAAEAA